jgi:ABC-type branched-subunit amino acid transport system ATPase component
MAADGRTVLLVEQNVRAGLKLASHGVVLEGGRVRLEGTGSEILANPQMRVLYLGGSVPKAAAPEAELTSAIERPSDGV